MSRDWLADIEASPTGPEVGAFFDFDGTLLAGYSIAAFIAERWRQRELGVADLARSAATLTGALAGTVSQREVIALGMAEWRGKRVEDMEATGRELFRRDIEPSLFPEMRQIMISQLNINFGFFQILAGKITHADFPRHVLCSGRQQLH